MGFEFSKSCRRCKYLAVCICDRVLLARALVSTKFTKSQVRGMCTFVTDKVDGKDKVREVIDDTPCGLVYLSRYNPHPKYTWSKDAHWVPYP